MTGSLAAPPWAARADDALDGAASIMIRNGLYLAETRFLDGVEAYNRHVMVLRDGTMRGGGGFYYTVGSYTCSGGKWKGEMTSQEHSPMAGKQSFRFKSIYRLLFAD